MTALVATSGNGCGISPAAIQVAIRQITHAQQADRTVCYTVNAGATMRTTAPFRITSASMRRKRTAILVSASSGLRLDFYFFSFCLLQVQGQGGKLRIYDKLGVQGDFQCLSFIGNVIQCVLRLHHVSPHIVHRASSDHVIVLNKIDKTVIWISPIVRDETKLRYGDKRLSQM